MKRTTTTARATMSHGVSSSLTRCKVKLARAMEPWTAEATHRNHRSPEESARPTAAPSASEWSASSSVRRTK